MLHEFLPAMLFALSIQAVLVISPGPGVMLVISSALEHGRAHSIITALGIACGSMLLVSSVVLGIAAVVTSNPMLLQIIRAVGAAFLLYLAYKAFASSRKPISFGLNNKAERRSTDYAKGWLQGFLLQVSNPKAIFGWLAIASAGGIGNAPVWINVLFVFLAFLNSFLGHGLYGILLSLPKMREGYKRHKFWIEITLALFFTYAAYKLLSWVITGTGG